MLIALTGAEIDARCGDESVPAWRPVLDRAGSEVGFGDMRRGARSYLAVAGGIDVAPMLGSRSTRYQRRARAVRWSRVDRRRCAADTLPAKRHMRSFKRDASTRHSRRCHGRSIRAMVRSRCADADCARCAVRISTASMPPRSTALFACGLPHRRRFQSRRLSPRRRAAGVARTAGTDFRRRRAGHGATAAGRQPDRADGRGADDRRLPAHRPGRSPSTCRAWRSAGPAYARALRPDLARRCANALSCSANGAAALAQQHRALP